MYSKDLLRELYLIWHHGTLRQRLLALGTSQHWASNKSSTHPLTSARLTATACIRRAGLRPNWAWCCCCLERAYFILGIHDSDRPIQKNIVHSVDLLHEWAYCRSINSTHLNPALHTDILNTRCTWELCVNTFKREIKIHTTAVNKRFNTTFLLNKSVQLNVQISQGSWRHRSNRRQDGKFFTTFLHSSDLNAAKYY